MEREKQRDHCLPLLVMPGRHGRCRWAEKGFAFLAVGGFASRNLDNTVKSHVWQQAFSHPPAAQTLHSKALVQRRPQQQGRQLVMKSAAAHCTDLSHGVPRKHGATWSSYLPQKR